MKRRDDIQKELNNIAPKLSERVPTNPFAVPDNYFDALPQMTLEHAKRMNDLVEGLKSESINSTKPFATPKHYFENLPNEILQRVKSEPKIIELEPTRWKNYFSIAAAVAALMLMSVPMLRKPNVSTNPVATNVTIEQVSSEELYDYLTNDVAAVHDEEIAAHVSEATLDTLEKQMISAHVSSSYDDALLDMTNLDLDLIESL